MPLPLHAASVLRTARERAGVSQRALARRAGTSQSVVARIETGVTDPTTATLERLVRAAGFELVCDVRPTGLRDTHMLDDVERILSLSPQERLIEVRNLARFESAAVRV